MRIIDADALMSRIEDSARNAGLHSEDYRKIKRFIAKTPTIDAENVRHGRWIRMDDTFTKWQCSACESKYHDAQWKFCPHCGAKMRGAAISDTIPNLRTDDIHSANQYKVVDMGEGMGECMLCVCDDGGAEDD